MFQPRSCYRAQEINILKENRYEQKETCHFSKLSKEGQEKLINQNVHSSD